MRTAVSVLATPHVQVAGKLASPLAAGISIDVQTVAGAPGDEVIRVDVGPRDRFPARLRLAFEMLGLALPLVEGEGQLLLVFHDFKDAGVIRALVPGDADGTDPHAIFHDPSPVGASNPSTVAVAGGATSAPGGGPA